MPPIVPNAVSFQAPEKPLCFGPAILTPLDSYRESVESTIFIDPSELKSQLDSTSASLKELTEEESATVEPVDLDDVNYVTKPLDSFSQFNLKRVVTIRIQTKEDRDKCSAISGTLPEWTGNSPHDLIALLKAAQLPSTLIPIKHWKEKELVHSLDGRKIADDPTNTLSEKYVAVFMPKQDKPYYRIDKISHVLDSSKYPNGPEVWALCALPARRTTKTNGFKAYLKTVKSLAGSASKVSDFAQTFSNLLSNVPYAPISMAGKTMSSLFKAGSPALQASSSYMKMVKSTNETFNSDNFQIINSVSKYTKQFLQRFRISGKKIYYRPSVNQRWKQIEFKSKSKGTNIVEAKIRGSTIIRNVIVYKITPLYLGSTPPFLEITPQYFVQTPTVNFTISDLPVKTGCEMGICRTVSYPGRDERCAASIPLLAGECPQRRAVESRIVKTECSEGDPLNLLLTARKRTVLVNCPSKTKDEFIMAGVNKIEKNCKVFLNKNTPSNMAEQSIVRHVSRLDGVVGGSSYTKNAIAKIFGLDPPDQQNSVVLDPPISRPSGVPTQGTDFDNDDDDDEYLYGGLTGLGVILFVLTSWCSICFTTRLCRGEPMIYNPVKLCRILCCCLGGGSTGSSNESTYQSVPRKEPSAPPTYHQDRELDELSRLNKENIRSLLNASRTGRRSYRDTDF